MVPADDEHKSANEAEKNTSTRRPLLEKLKFWQRRKKDNDEHTDSTEATSDTNKKEREPGRLTPMPDCLMHWWTPLLVALILFILSFICAWAWGWQWDWPSSKAMKLCMTITGAGLAFSAWQQRSHDNATNAKQAQAAIERDDYWKRREHILHTLDSDNPRIRLVAISLLAELADSAAHSTLLNPTAQRQLQQHIISTLCLQIYHEGLAISSEGTKEEHAEIQNAILRVILDRIRDTAPENNYANWSQHEINLSNSTLHTPLTITDIQTKATLDLQQSTFTKEVVIRDSKLKKLLWSDATFHESIDVNSTDKGVSSTDKRTEISIDSIPNNITAAYFTNCNIITSRELSIDFSQRTREGNHFPELNFENCTFMPASCECNNSCDCQHTNIHISNVDKSRNPNQQTTTITLKKCTFHSLYLYFTTISSKVDILGNTIHNQLSVNFMSPEDATDSADRLFTADARIAIRDNKLVKGTQTQPIQITTESRQRINSILQIDDNFATNPNDASDDRVITCSLVNENPLTFHFKEDSTSTSTPLFNPWSTGQLTPPSSEIDNTGRPDRY